MAKHPLLKKKAAGSGWNMCDPKGGVSGEGKTREGLNTVLEMSKASVSKMRLAKKTPWTVVIRKGPQAREEVVESESYKGAERAVKPKLKEGENIASISLAKTSGKMAAATKQLECCGGFHGRHKTTCPVWQANFEKTIKMLPGLDQSKKTSGYLTIAEVKDVYEQGKRKGRFVESAEGILDTRDNIFIPWSEAEKARGRGQDVKIPEDTRPGGTGDYDFYKADPGSPAGDEEWIAMKEMGIRGAAKAASAHDEGAKAREHNESLDDNPYARYSQPWEQWQGGWKGEKVKFQTNRFTAKFLQKKTSAKDFQWSKGPKQAARGDKRSDPRTYLWMLEYVGLDPVPEEPFPVWVERRQQEEEQKEQGLSTTAG
jgi:hypothetical protein